MKKDTGKIEYTMSKNRKNTIYDHDVTVVREGEGGGGHEGLVPG